jgi:hypothetical protein
MPNLRPKWAKPKTPLMFKETPSTPSHTGSYATLSSKAQESPETSYGTSPLVTAGSYVLASASRGLSSDASALAERIAKLTEAKKSRMLQLLEELETDEEAQGPSALINVS